MFPEPHSDEIVLLTTRHWLERAVIGLSLCPFANAAHTKGRIRSVVSSAETADALRADLHRELQALSEADPELVETTLLIAPHVLGEFLDFNAFLTVANATLEELGLVGTLQIASFHPHYEFSDLDRNDVANCSNRSPYPILHLLREASVNRAVESFPEASQIFEKNIQTLRELGHEGFARVLATDETRAEPGGFDSLALSPSLRTVATELGFETLTPIQAESIPVLLSGQDLVGKAKTGSGKTVAFALPLLERLNLGTRELQGLVLCPTRELGAQVARELRKLGRRQPGLAVVLLSGGEPVRDQSRALERGAHLAVGTPGRVLDHLRRRTLRVHRIATVVLDEADRMLDMGFLHDIEQVLKALPKERQTVFFSATFGASIRELSEKHQRSPVRVGLDEGAEAPPDIVQLVVHGEAAKKVELLRWVLDNHPHETALVFANQKRTVAELEKSLAAAGTSVASLHGDLEQRDRERVMAKFRNGSTRVLLATDVAARGIDLESLSLVVNFDLPTQTEQYVHRIGRTGRAGKAGLAISLCAPGDEQKLAGIQHFTGIPLTPLRAEPKGRRNPAAPAVAAAAAPSTDRAPMDTLRLSGGRKDKLRAGDILGALTGEAGGLSGDDVGKIEIHERHAFVAIKKGESHKALASLRAGRIKGRRFRIDLVE